MVLGAFKMGMGVTANEAQELFDVMARMGSAGTFTFSAQAQNAEKLFMTSAKMLGVGKDNFAQYNAFLQMTKTAFGSGEAAASAVESIATMLATDPNRRAAVGRDLFDADGNVKDFAKLINRISEMSESSRKRIFGNKSKAFLPFTTDAGKEQFQNFIKEGQKAGYVADAFAKKQQGAKFQLAMLTAAGKEFADAALSPAIASLTADISALTRDPAAMKEFRENLLGIGNALGSIGSAIAWVGKGVVAYSNFFERLGEAFGGSGTLSEKTLQKRNMNLAKKRGAAASPYGKTLADGAKRANNNAPDVKNNININMQVTESGRIITETTGQNTTTSVSLDKRGRFK